MHAMKNSTRRVTPTIDTRFDLIELASLGKVVTEVPAREQVHHQVQVVPILERVRHVDDEGMSEVGKDAPFVDNGTLATFGNDPRLRHLLQSVKLLAVLLLHLPHLAEPAPSDHVVELEHVARDRYSALPVALHSHITSVGFSA